MIPAHVPRILQRLLSGYVWRMSTAEKVLYLTFDDGPIPEVTPWVLDELARHSAKATFFCLGRNCAANPDLVARICLEGHGIGNHTWAHERGRHTSEPDYMISLAKAQEWTRTKAFRPPYGSITRAQARAIRYSHQIVLWDVLSLDYVTSLSGKHCARNVIRHARPGSIVVFHDSLKAEPRLRVALPAVLTHFSAAGYRFAALPFAIPSLLR